MLKFKHAQKQIVHLNLGFSWKMDVKETKLMSLLIRFWDGERMSLSSYVLTSFSVKFPSFHTSYVKVTWIKYQQCTYISVGHVTYAVTTSKMWHFEDPKISSQQFHNHII